MAKNNSIRLGKCPQEEKRNAPLRVLKPTGNITLFAFDKGEGLAEHSSPHEALVQLLDGKAEVTIGGTAYNLQTGQSIILPADIPHSL